MNELRMKSKQKALFDLPAPPEGEISDAEKVASSLVERLHCLIQLSRMHGVLSLTESTEINQVICRLLLSEDPVVRDVLISKLNGRKLRAADLPIGGLWVGELLAMVIKAIYSTDGGSAHPSYIWDISSAEIVAGFEEMWRFHDPAMGNPNIPSGDAAVELRAKFPHFSKLIYGRE
jgi:hypothetical protein